MGTWFGFGSTITGGIGRLPAIEKDMQAVPRLVRGDSSPSAISSYSSFYSSCPTLDPEVEHRLDARYFARIPGPPWRTH